MKVTVILRRLVANILASDDVPSQLFMVLFISPLTLGIYLVLNGFRLPVQVLHTQSYLDIREGVRYI